LKGEAEANLPVVTVSARGAARLRDGHVWVYRSDIEQANGISPAAMVAVQDSRGRSLGTALYSNSSQIAIRLISTRAVADLSLLLRERLRQAILYRDLVVKDTNAYRLVFSEGDSLPGLIVDRYNDVISFQVLTQAMDTGAVRATLLKELSEQFSPAGIVERVDSRVRELEQLPERRSGLVEGEKADTTICMNGVQFRYSALEGQKTGAFLDQRENYAAAAQYARGDALDVFCYQGGFALNLARQCSHVTGVDSSRPALETADRNAALNGVEIEWMEANAFDLLKDYAAAGKKYDTIVLDPPAFAKSRKTLATALRGYKELNLRALKMLRAGGVLVTCSCSYHVSQPDFLETISQAAIDARKSLRILEMRGQAKDHPFVLNIPETSYLKAVILYVNN
jgi:23S rRNA (cytosine1962-C5)-methyltransferase